MMPSQVIPGDFQGWAGARVGIGMLWSGEILLVENKKQMLKFLQVKIKKDLQLCKVLWLKLPNFHFMFLIDIDFIFKICKTDFHDLSAHVFSEICEIFDVQYLEI